MFALAGHPAEASALAAEAVLLVLEVDEGFAESLGEAWHQAPAHESAPKRRATIWSFICFSLVLTSQHQ